MRCGLKKNEKFVMITVLTAIFLGIIQFVSLAATYTNYPEAVVCTPNGDMKTSIGFAWYTNTEVTGSVVQLRVAGDSREFGSDPSLTFTGTCETVSHGTLSYNVHKVVATGLNPGTKYEYRVGDLEKGYWSTDANSLNSVGYFETAPEKEEEFTFINLGDVNGGSESTMQAFGKVLERVVGLFPSYKFIVQNGDMANHMTDKNIKEREWKWFFKYAQPYLKNTIWAGALGNHDAAPDYSNFHQHFNYQLAGDEGIYYSFDYSNAHFLVLDTEYAKTDQIDWAIYDVVKNNKKWNIAIFHKPLYSNGPHYNEERTRTLWSGPLCDVLGMDIIFTGHDHVYNRGYYLKNGQPVSDDINVEINGIVTNPIGTLFVLPNCSATKFYEPNTSFNAEYIKFSAQPYRSTYTGVHVTEDQLTCEVYYLDNNQDVLLDSFGIKKTKQQPPAPQNVKIFYDEQTKSATIRWEDANTENVRDYVIYDENNKYKKNWTHFMKGTGVKFYTINNLTKEQFQECKFAVKAVGDKSFSEAAIAVVEKGIMKVKDVRYYDQSIGKVLVKGQIDRSHAGEQITLLLQKKGIQNITAQEIGYMDQTVINYDGSYAFSFPFNKNIEEYELKMYMGGKLVNSTVTEALAGYSWLDAKIELFIREDGTLSSEVTINNYSNIENLTYTICIAFYDGNNKLLGVSKKDDVIAADIVTDLLNADIPSGAVRGVATIWSNYTEIIPLAPANTITIE